MRIIAIFDWTAATHSSNLHLHQWGAQAMGSIDEEVQARRKNQETAENIGMAVLTCALILATVAKPWLLVWVVGTPLLLASAVGAMKLRGWFRTRLISVHSER
jgi:hypothetical protein